MEKVAAGGRGGHLFGIDGELGRRGARSPLRSGRAYGELEPKLRDLSPTFIRISGDSVTPTGGIRTPSAAAAATRVVAVYQNSRAARFANENQEKHKASAWISNLPESEPPDLISCSRCGSDHVCMREVEGFSV